MRLFTLFSLLFSIAFSHAAPVWKVSDGQRHLFIGGTIHLLAEQDYPLPGAFEQAFQQASHLVFETDMEKVNSESFMAAAMSEMTFTDGTTINDVLRADTVQKLRTHLDSRGLSLERFSHFKPALLSITLSAIEFQLMGMDQDGVDSYFFQRGVKQDKDISWLESVDTQLNFIANLGSEDQDGLIRYTLEEISQLSPMMANMKAFWRAGDMHSLDKQNVAPLRQDFPQIYQDLLVTRNHNWMPVIEKLLATDETEFILVGALHLAGTPSVLKLLEDKGYRVSQLENQ